MRLAVVASHPVQYQAPWYRALAARVDLHVFFAHRIQPADHARSGFGVPFEWDTPVLDGYSHSWLENVSARPGVETFRGCDTPGIAGLLAGGRFDAVAVNGWQVLSYWQAARAARRARIIAIVRGDSQLVTPRSALHRSAKRVFYPRLLKAFDAYLAVGERNEQYYRHYGAPASRIFRSPHCVDNDFFARAAEAARQPSGRARAELGLARDAIVFTFVGKLIDKKRPLDFLAALDAARAAEPRVVGLIVGDGPLRNVVDMHIKRQETPCTTVGFMNQRRLATAYAASDALVLPSDGRETWGLVVNEAMATGLPAVVSDQAGCAPDLIADGVTGYSFPCGDVAALADRMRRLAGAPELRAEMRTAVRRHIDGYSPTVAAAGVVSAMEDLSCRC
jgi:glycosyltransferase involved in cell wall biosynthesis